jgi:glycosyltransferase involved in cell wall biosynthesis
VRHGEHAWVLDRADAEGIAGAIAELHDNPALVARLTQGAAAFAAEHFSWPRSARRLLEFYRSLTALAAPPHPSEPDTAATARG